MLLKSVFWETIYETINSQSKLVFPYNFPYISNRQNWMWIWSGISFRRETIALKHWIYCGNYSQSHQTKWKSETGLNWIQPQRNSRKFIINIPLFIKKFSVDINLFFYWFSIYHFFITLNKSFQLSSARIWKEKLLLNNTTKTFISKTYNNF